MMQTTGRLGGAGALVVSSALVLALGAPAAAFAADPTPPVPDASTPKEIVLANGEQESAITGTVKATTLKVSVPTQVSFYIDPGATPSTDAKDWSTNTKIGQFTSPSNFTVTNYSAVDVYGFVSGVTSDWVTLVDSGELSKPGGVKPGFDSKGRIKVKIGLGDPAMAMNLATPGDWMTEAGVADADGKRYYAFNRAGKGLLASSPDGTNVEDGTNRGDKAKGSYTVTIRGEVKSGGWSQDDNFLVKPKFKIVAAKPA